MDQQNKRVRTRYAPSPTGYQHIGGIRTAILNYFIAQKLGGDFIIRIEDTDFKRFVPGAEQYILETLEWLDIPYTEGPDIGGPFGPYRQSERKSMYMGYALQLVNSGKAYYAFDTVETLTKAREQAEANGGSLIYNYLRVNDFSNSISLPAQETADKLANNYPYVIRLKLPQDTTISFNDLIRGEISVHTSELEDRVLLKSDGWPTYHLANIVDDKLMEITHVIRGEEWLPSAPVHYYLYEALGWESDRPLFAHLPLILNPDGDGKLSKRKLKDASIPIFPLNWVNQDSNIVKGMREEGFLPEAVINILVLLGWHSVGSQEIFSKEEISSILKISDIQKSGAKFDYNKARWVNAQYINRAKATYLTELYTELYGDQNINRERLIKTISFLKSRISVLKEVQHYTFLFKDNFQINNSISDALLPIKLQQAFHHLSSVAEWDETSLRECFKAIKIDFGDDANEMYPLIRETISGKKVGIDVIQCLLILERKESLRRFAGYGQAANAS